jgi:hypothetical protein
VVSADSSAQEIKNLKNRKDAEWLCELFMVKLVELGTEEAFMTLRPYSVVTEENFEIFVDQADKIIETVKPDYGAVVGHVLLQERSVKDTVLRYVYLLKFEKYALRWMFYFYRADDEWLFSEFNVDNKLYELFD